MPSRTALPLGLVVAGLSTIAYAAGVERTRWTLRRSDVPVLPPGRAPLRLLHLSDLHMTPRQFGKQLWVRELAALRPDLVVVTGDNLAHPDAVPAVAYALQPLFDIPGLVVFGSNDYYGPRPVNPLRYFNARRRRPGDPLPWRDLRAALTAGGWRDLTHVRTHLSVGGLTLQVAGVDDPHLHRDRYDEIAGPVDPACDVHLGLLHSPEPRVLDRFAADGYDLLLAGHTHGGQVRVPFYGALVTNCGLDTARARGLHRYGDRTWLHVSAGLGTSPYAPIRFACPPEASLLTLVPRPVG